MSEMQIETFEELELNENLETECEEAAIALIETLGLEGQKSLFSKSENEDADTLRCPYRQQTTEETTVYEIILPDICPIEQYAAGPIPLRVLQIAAHAKQFFAYIYVAYDKQKLDPILLGSQKNNSWQRGEMFILARWGRELTHFSKLRETAAKLLKAKKLLKLKEILSEVNTDIATTNSLAPDEMLVKGNNMPSYFSR